MSGPEQKQVTRRLYLRRLSLLGLAIIAIGLSWVFMARAASLRLYVVPSVSMSPAILPNDRVAVELTRTTRPKRGEIWIFTMPPTGVTLPGEAIKRVIGLPGETIAVEGGKVLINGRAIEEPYLVLPMTYTMPARTLSSTDYFMMGDNRNASADSHIWGPVPEDQLKGRVLYRVWPLQRTGGL